MYNAAVNNVTAIMFITPPRPYLPQFGQEAYWVVEVAHGAFPSYPILHSYPHSHAPSLSPTISLQVDNEVAIQAGVQVGDLLVEVDGQSIEERSVVEVIDYIRKAKCYDVVYTL